MTPNSMNPTLLPPPAGDAPFDAQAYLDKRRDAYLAEERALLEALRGRVERFTAEDLLRIARRGFAAGARAQADAVMIREAEEEYREDCDRKLEAARLHHLHLVPR